MTGKKATKGKRASAKKPTPSVTAADADRELEIFRGHLRGLSIPNLTRLYSLTASEIDEIVKRLTAEAAQLREQHGDVIEVWLQRQDAAIDELAAVAAKEKGSARVTAIRTRTDLERQKVEQMRDLGLLPGGTGKALSSDALNRLAQGDDAEDDD